MAPVSDYLILDIATAGLPGVEKFIDTPKGRKGTKDEAKIEAQIAAKLAAEIDGAGLDADLCQITAIGVIGRDGKLAIDTRQDADEVELVRAVLERITPNTVLVGFNSLAFDWPVLIRRCQYLGLTPPAISLDKYRTPHIDVYDRLSHHGVTDARSLAFYVRRHGWSDLAKPLSGAEESKVFETGKWDELVASLEHDLTATARLAAWLGYIELPVVKGAA